jgi:tRNA modification GTPase
VSDTVFALATAPARAAIAVVRVSGPAARAALAALGVAEPEPRRATLARLRTSGDELDEALVLWFPEPRSFTGEDVVELHVHGGRAVVDALTEALAAAGLRPADPGEFTRRAFQNGRLDLAQAEAVADLIDAETGQQRRQALAQLEGALGRRHGAWRETLVRILGFLETEIDFPDEDLPGAVSERARPLIAGLADEIAAALADVARGERVREGFRVAVIGAPNAGKSSILNGLLMRDAAIVTPLPGTTRDVIEAPLDLAGYRVLLADTAGLRETSDVVEVEGVRRARAWAEAADLRLLVVDSSTGDEIWRAGAGETRPGDLCVLNKGDLPSAPAADAACAWAASAGLSVVRTSAASLEGLALLRAALQEVVVGRLSGADFPATTRLRHRAMLCEAEDHLRRALQALDLGAELAAEDVRLAARALGRVTGEVDSESVLGEIFASFCIGK